MKIEKVRVSYSETVSLPGYNNVKPGLTLEAHVEEGEDPDVVRQSLQTEVQNIVREQVNQALEQCDEPAKYHDGPWYAVRHSSALEAIAVVPERLDKSEEGRLEYFSPAWQVHRPAFALRRGQEWAEREGYNFFALLEGDLSPLEILPEPEEEPEPQMPF